MQKLVQVEWADAAHAPTHWQEEIGVAQVFSVGYLVLKNKHEVVLALSRAADGDYGGKLAIPRGFVKSIQGLEVSLKKRKKTSNQKGL